MKTHSGMDEMTMARQLLALAVRGTFTLHASALQGPLGIVAFIGESGVGKSTLAAWGERQGAWRRVADDLLPVSYDDAGHLRAFAFPQPKAPCAPPSEPVRSIVLVEPVTTMAAAECHRLDAETFMCHLIRQTAACRLFDVPQLQAHFDWAARVVAHMDGWRLRVPRDMNRLPETFAALHGRLGIPAMPECA